MNPNSILEYLSMISNENLSINLTMHLVVILSIISIYLIKDSKVKKQLYNGTIVTLLASVTINAAIYGNPFHVITFAIMAIIAVTELIRRKNPIDIPQDKVITIISFSFIVIGLWYPDFVTVNTLASVLFSPVGIIPCPTLLTVLGMLNLFYPKVNKSQFAIMIFFGMVYGIIGTIILKVYLDVSLIALVIFSIYNVIKHRKTRKQLS